LIRDWLHVGYRVSLYTNRKMLIEQLSRVLSEFGLQHGLRTASNIEQGEIPCESPLQISSVQTEASRTLKKKVWQLHAADLVLIDEAHLNAAETPQELCRMNLENGATIVGLTATPLDLGHMYDHLICAATNSELRECGALVPAVHYGPDEPDTRKIKKAEWEYTENDVRKVMKVHNIFGRVLEWFNKLNPDRRPTLCFAPGVPESIWLCEQFNAAGISAAHIDGRTCVYQGERHDSDPEIRREIMRASKSGEITILCNRFVLREGIDAPWLAHGIFATVFGTLQSYLQSGGRLLRAYRGKEFVTVQDHGGNWHRHGSLNADRHWQLGDTDAIVQGLRLEALRNKQKTGEAEPMRCPQCARILMTSKCSCGFAVGLRTRPVFQEDGKLREMTGEIFKRRQTKTLPNTQEIWTRTYHRAKNSRKGMTFNQARGLFFYENHYWPPEHMPFMPTKERDWFRKVADVPRSDLK